MGLTLAAPVLFHFWLARAFAAELGARAAGAAVALAVTLKSTMVPR